jgi:hypothetical protein
VDLLNEAIRSISKFITTEYYDALKEYRTVGQRNALIERVISGALQTQGECNALISMLDDLIQDVDKASFHLRHMLDALQLLDSSKGGRVI